MSNSTLDQPHVESSIGTPQNNGSLRRIHALILAASLSFAGCAKNQEKSVADSKQEAADTEQKAKIGENNESSPKDAEPTKEDTFAKAIDELINAQSKRLTKAKEDMEAAQDKLATLEIELSNLATTTDHESIIQTLQEMDQVSATLMRNAMRLKAGHIVSIDINDALAIMGRTIETLEEPSMRAQAEAIRGQIRDRGILPFAVAAADRKEVALVGVEKKVEVVELRTLVDGTEPSKERLTLQQWHERQVVAMKKVEEQKVETKKE